MTTHTDDVLPIRLWWGYRRPELPRADFLTKLARSLMPATIHTMNDQLRALVAYLPVVPPVVTSSTFSGQPDELALVVYRSVADYERAAATLEGQVYQDLHGAIFASPSSSKGFPKRFAGEVALDQPYFLQFGQTDWQKGHVNFYLAKRPQSVDQSAFLSLLADRLTEASTIDGAKAPSCVLIRTDGLWVSYFELWSGSSIPSAIASSLVKEVTTPIWSQPAAPVSTPRLLNDAGKWLHLSDSGEFLNFTF